MVSKEENLVNEIVSRFDIEGNVERESRLSVSVDQENLLDLCRWLKDKGFDHLSAISVTDWPEKNIFEITYHLWSYGLKVLITVKTKIGREKAKISSVTRVWRENAQIHERELHELFGIDFKGNLDLEPLFLDEWSGPPPFRKDFNWREYVRKEFYDRGNERERVYFD